MIARQIARALNFLADTKVGLALGVAGFGAFFSLALAVVVGVGGNSFEVNPLRSSAGYDPGYGYQNPRSFLQDGPSFVVPGSKQTTIITFNVYAPADRAITTQQYNFSLSDNPKALTNFTLIKDGSKVGTSIKSLDYGVFTFNGPVVIPANTFASFVVTADVVDKVTEPPVYGYPTPPGVGVLLQSINYSDTRTSFMEGVPLGRSIYIATSRPDQINAVLDSSVVPPQSVVAGSENIEILRLVFSGGSFGDTALTRITLGTTSIGAHKALKNIRVYDANTLLGTVSRLSERDGDMYFGVVRFVAPFVIGRFSSRTMRVVADIEPKQQFVFTLGLVGLAAKTPINYGSCLEDFPLLQHFND